jgi:hypothetical protein
VSRSHGLDVADRDPIELAADAFCERPVHGDFEPVDFDDVRLAERFGVTGGHFPGLDAHDDDWMVF